MISPEKSSSLFMPERKSICITSWGSDASIWLSYSWIMVFCSRK
jgi:hypothetical protein